MGLITEIIESLEDETLKNLIKSSSESSGTHSINVFDNILWFLRTRKRGHSTSHIVSILGKDGIYLDMISTQQMGKIIQARVAQIKADCGEGKAHFEADYELYATLIEEAEHRFGLENVCEARFG